MAKEVSVSFKLGATLAGSYRTAFQDAAGQARMVSQAIREMGNTPVGQLGAALEKQGARLTGLAGKLEPRRRVRGLPPPASPPASRRRKAGYST